MAEITLTEGIVPKLPCDDYFTPEARKLCARVKHKSELMDDETLMLALAAAQAALARCWHQGERSAEETLQTIGAILEHRVRRRADRGPGRQGGGCPCKGRQHFLLQH
jgi:hypothetical protein